MSVTHPSVLLRAVLALLSLCVSSSSSALANRVFVSARSGNDANACDNILAPCQTFAGAVTKLNPGGEAIVLDSGGYGPVTITQSLTIEAPPGVVAFIHPTSGDAVTINACSGDKVVLRGLVLNGGFPASGSGIVANTVGTLHVENCVINNFNGDGVFSSATKTFIKDTISRQNANGIDIRAGRASLDHCRFEGNAARGVFVENADVTVRDSVSAGNLNGGFEALAFAGDTTVLVLYACESSSNSEDGLIAQSFGGGNTVVRVANSSISENVGAGLHNAGNELFVSFESLGNSLVRGNFGGDTVGTIAVVPAK